MLIINFEDLVLNKDVIKVFCFHYLNNLRFSWFSLDILVENYILKNITSTYVISNTIQHKLSHYFDRFIIQTRKIYAVRLFLLFRRLYHTLILLNWSKNLKIISWRVFCWRCFINLLVIIFVVIYTNILYHFEDFIKYDVSFKLWFH